MGGCGMNAFLTHFGIRFRYSVVSRGTLLSLVLTSIASLFFWPGSTDSNATGWQAGSTPSGLVEGPALGLLLMGLWIWLWPALPILSVSGLITSNKKKTFSMGPLPTLPVGYRTRALAESCVVVTFVVLTQVTAILLLDPKLLFIGHVFNDLTSRSELILHSLSGAVIIFPILLSWALPASSFESKWFKPLIWIALVLGSVKLGGLATPLRSVSTSLLLSAAVLLTCRLEFGFTRFAPKHRSCPESRFRLFKPPFSQLVYDAWRLPFSRLGAVMALLFSIEVICIVLDYYFPLPELSVYLCTTLVLSFFLPFVVLRPFGSKQLIASAWGAPGFEPGDFIRAWLVLPVRPIWVLRAVWVHGMVLGIFIWVAAIFIGSFTTWLEIGQFALLDSDGDPVGFLFIPLVAAVPCVAGMLVSAAAGNVTRSFLSAACLVLSLAGHILLIALRAPTPVHVLVVAVLAGTGGLLPLKYLLPLTSLRPSNLL